MNYINVNETITLVETYNKIKVVNSFFGTINLDEVFIVVSSDSRYYAVDETSYDISEVYRLANGNYIYAYGEPCNNSNNSSSSNHSSYNPYELERQNLLQKKKKMVEYYNTYRRYVYRFYEEEKIMDFVQKRYSNLQVLAVWTENDYQGYSYVYYINKSQKIFTIEMKELPKNISRKTYPAIRIENQKYVIKATDFSKVSEDKKNLMKLINEKEEEVRKMEIDVSKEKRAEYDLEKITEDKISKSTVAIFSIVIINVVTFALKFIKVDLNIFIYIFMISLPILSVVYYCKCKKDMAEIKANIKEKENNAWKKKKSEIERIREKISNLEKSLGQFKTFKKGRP